MSEELTMREEIVKIIDETPDELKGLFTESFDAVSEETVSDMFSDIPDIAILPQETKMAIFRSIVNTFFSRFDEEMRAFCEHWKNQVPPEEVVDHMNDGDYDGFTGAFFSDMDLVTKKILMDTVVVLDPKDFPERKKD